MDLPLVSLITPAYNAAKHLRPYLKGVLSQTYPNVQYIFVNDGSVDETEDLILSAKEDILAKGWEFLYIKQLNAGQATAVNAALSHVKGEYFAQIDSDDIMYPDYLAKYCKFLEVHKEFKFCYSRVALQREDEAIPYRLQYRSVEARELDDFFGDLIQEKNVPPLAFYMIDTKAFFAVVKLPLYTNRGGQNWQILLPMAYHYKCGYIEEVLAACIERNQSHHRAQDVARVHKLKQILFHTISRIDMPDGEKAFWYDNITNKYLIKEPSQLSKVLLFGRIPFLKIRRDKIYLFDFLRIGTIRHA